jgi:type IV pilus modification protein PilV
MRRTSGFTLVEVLVALLLGAIGLLGTLAVQQAVISASKTANDAAVALRLASQKLEEFNTVLTTGDPNTPTGYSTDAGPRSNVDQFYANGMANGAWTPTSGMPVNAEGIESAAGKAPEYRWIRMWRVVNLGYGQPYVISVAVTYRSGTGDPKTVRLDMERRKSW